MEALGKVIPPATFLYQALVYIPIEAYISLGSENLSSSPKDEEGSSGSNHRLFCPDRCHLLIATISRNADQRRALSCEISGDDAQLMVDYLDIVRPKKVVAIGNIQLKYR